MSLQKGFPRHPFLPEGGGVDPLFQKDSFDRVASAKSLCDEALADSARRDLVAEIAECASDSGVAPARAVTGHPDDQLLAEYPILFLQVLDDVLLIAIHPSGEDQHQKLKLQSVHGPQRISVSV
jgi:hypothetical protein